MSTLVSYMRQFSAVAQNSLKVRTGDADTMAAIIEYAQLYIQYLQEPQSSQLKQRFWPNILTLSKLQPSDLAEELVTDKDLKVVSNEVAQFWSAAARAARSDNIWTKLARLFRSQSAYQTALSRLQADLQNTKPQLDVLLLSIHEASSLSKTESTDHLRPAEAFFKLFTSKYPLDLSASGVSLVQQFMRLTDTLRILLPMSKEDQLFYRLMQGWMYSWSNYRYLNLAAAGVVSSKVRQETNLYEGWASLANRIWTA